MSDTLSGLDGRALRWLADEAVRKRSPHAPDEPLRLKFKGVWYEVSQPHEPGAPAEVRPTKTERVIR